MSDAKLPADPLGEIKSLVATAKIDMEQRRESEAKEAAIHIERDCLYKAVADVAEFVAGSDTNWAERWGDLFLAAGAELNKFKLAAGLETLRYDGLDAAFKTGTEAAFRLYQLACAGDRDAIVAGLKALSDSGVAGGSVRAFLYNVRDKAYPWTDPEASRIPRSHGNSGVGTSMRARTPPSSLADGVRAPTDPLTEVWTVILDTAHGRREHLRRPWPDRLSERQMLVRMDQGQLQRWENCLDAACTTISNDLLSIGRQPDEVRTLIDAIRIPVHQINRAGVAASALDASEREHSAQQIVAPLETAALEALNKLADAWRALPHPPGSPTGPVTVGTDVTDTFEFMVVGQALRAIRDYHSCLATGRIEKTVTDEVRSRLRYNLLHMWCCLRCLDPESLGARCGTKRDRVKAAAQFADLYARRVPADTSDLDDFARYGWPPIRQYGANAPPPSPSKPNVVTYDADGGITHVATISIMSGDPPPLGGEPGDLPNWEPDFEAMLKEYWRLERGDGSPPLPQTAADNRSRRPLDPPPITAEQLREKLRERIPAEKAQQLREWLKTLRENCTTAWLSFKGYINENQSIADRSGVLKAVRDGVHTIRSDAFAAELAPAPPEGTETAGTLQTVRAAREMIGAVQRWVDEIEVRLAAIEADMGRVPPAGGTAGSVKGEEPPAPGNPPDAPEVPPQRFEKAQKNVSFPRPDRPNAAYCLPRPGKIRWVGEADIPPRLGDLLRYILEQPDDVESVPFAEVKADAFGSASKSHKSVRNDVGELSSKLLLIKFPWTVATKLSCLVIDRG